jgi:hypothetical protein
MGDTNRGGRSNQAFKSSAPEDYKTLSQCVVRVINRLGATAERSDGIVFVSLASKLAARLGWKTDLGSESFNRMLTIVFGIYKGALETIESW